MFQPSRSHPFKDNFSTQPDKFTPFSPISAPSHHSSWLLYQVVKFGEGDAKGVKASEKGGEADGKVKRVIKVRRV